MVLAANVHAIMVLIHTQDTVVGCIQEVGKVMGCAGGPQLFMKEDRFSLVTAAVGDTNLLIHTKLTHSSCLFCIAT